MNLPLESKYEIATRDMRSRNARKEKLKSFLGLLVVLICGSAIISTAGIVYWICEVASSLIIDALIYVVAPFFAFALIIALFKNWNAVWREIGQAFKDMIEIVSMR